MNPEPRMTPDARQGLRGTRLLSSPGPGDPGRAMDAADRARRLLRCPPLQRLPGPPRHPEGGADGAAERASRAWDHGAASGYEGRPAALRTHLRWAGSVA